MESKLKGVKMELDDCAFPLLHGINTTSNLSVGYKDCDAAFLVGSKPRGPGMERGDLLKQNGAIFVEQGKAIGENASRHVKVLVVGNPANTNCLIAMKNAKGLKPENFNAMTRLDHNRALSQLAEKANCKTTDIKNMTIWGNHSSTMYPDLHCTSINGKSALEIVGQEWYEKSFIPTVAKRGAAIIDARGASSAASAANAAIDHMRDWFLGTNEWVSMAVPTDGTQYGVEKDLVYSFPCVVKNGVYSIVQGIKLNDFSKERMKITTDELISERRDVEHLL